MNSFSRTIEIINALFSAYKADFSSLKESRAEDVKAIDATSVVKSTDVIASLRDRLVTVAKSVSIDGASVDKFATNYSIIEDGKGGIDRIEFTVKSAMRAEFPYRYTHEISGTSDIFDGMADTLAYALTQIYKTNIAGENITELNGILDSLFETEGVTAKFNFALSDKYIVSITNDCVTFGVSADKAIEIGKCELLRGGNEFEDSCREKEVAKIISAVKAAGTTVKIIKAGIDIIAELTEFKSKKRADSLIRKSYSKKAQYIPAKGGVGYIEKDIKIDGEDVSIFALVGKDADGNASVVLNPFNINTLFNVEYDVLADLA